MLPNAVRSRTYSVFTACCLRQVLLMTEDVDKVAAYATAAQRKNATTAAANANSLPSASASSSSSSSPSSYVAIRGSPPFFVEFLDVSTNKGKGLERLCDLLSLPPSFDGTGQALQGSHESQATRASLPLASVVAFGDGDNDLEMLST